MQHHLTPQVRLVHRTLRLFSCHVYASRLLGIVPAVRKATIRTEYASSPLLSVSSHLPSLAKSVRGVLDPDDERSLVFLQTIILVTFPACGASGCFLCPSAMEDLRTMLDSIDRSELYNPVYPVDMPISDPDIASADEKYIRIRITSEYEWQPPTTVTAVSIFPELGPDSILVERAPDRNFGQTMC